DIVLPFAAILSANFLARFFPARPSTWVCRFQVWLSVHVCLLALVLSVYAFRGTGYLWSAAVPGAVLALFVLRRHDTPASKVLVFPVLAVQSIFVFLVLANWMYFLRYDAAHKLASDLARRPDLALYDYRVRSIAL